VKRSHCVKVVGPQCRSPGDTQLPPSIMRKCRAHKSRLPAPIAREQKLRGPPRHLMRDEIFAIKHGVQQGKQQAMRNDEGPSTPQQSKRLSRH